MEITSWNFIFVLVAMLSLANSTIHSYQNFYSQCEKDINGNICPQGWCFNQRTLNQIKAHNSMCTKKPSNSNENWRIVYDFCQMDSSTRTACSSKCCEIMYMGYQEEKSVRAFCCDGFLATWCNAQETLAIKADWVSKQAIQKETQKSTMIQIEKAQEQPKEKNLRQFANVLLKAANNYWTPSK